MEDRLIFPREIDITPGTKQDREMIAMFALLDLQPWLESIPREGLTTNAADYRGLSFSKYFGWADYVALSDGVAIIWNTAHSLENRAHRLVLTDESDIFYHREAFFVDSQKVPSPTLDLAGFDQVTDEDDPVLGMLYAVDLIRWTGGKEHLWLAEKN